MVFGKSKGKSSITNEYHAAEIERLTTEINKLQRELKVCYKISYILYLKKFKKLVV